ncbi:SRPBCC family protein [Streptomyces sp. NPDC048279]|uniref:SRPBCC family protein n=1 Tax=Streptomyces sp. NPDC048279 TaxID=3154714 RepID=UPI00342A3565
MAAELTGTCLTLDDGRFAVRFTRTYDHPAQRVWLFVNDPDESARWFPSRLDIEPRDGGTVRFSGDPRQANATGTVLAFDEPRHLSFTWGGDEGRFDLAALDAKRTRFTLTQVLAEQNAAAPNGAGWEVCLLALDALARGEGHAGPHSEDAADWREFYDAYLDAGVPSGAPIPGPDA